MKLQTKIPLKKATYPIDYHSTVVLLGSCFVENIGNKLDYYKFQLAQNPFGILFHPKAIEKLIYYVVDKRKYTEKDVFFLNERWHCFDAHSSLSNVSKEKLLETLNLVLENTYQQITKASHIIITLGTAWTYEHIKKGITVANCHKVPQKEFSKKIITANKIVESLENSIRKIQTINKELQFIFTVSPVRHLKDGFIENLQSKSHLITAIHQVLKKEKVFYFPSYEIMMDELRDYRFYTNDMLHPSPLAIDYIWEKFIIAWIKEETITDMEKVGAIQRGLQHQPFNPTAEQHQRFLKDLNNKIESLQSKHPFIKFNKESI